ncbi:DUF4148 domain-containing protein [Massilia sp. YMA4]|nr:DUF4148 domain-containing protein [Massilia sp. YMA4]
MDILPAYSTFQEVIMKTAYYVIAALALATAGAAFGAEGNEAAAAAAPAAAAVATAHTQVNVPAARALTRAEVRAQAIEARRNGTLIENEADLDVAQTKKHYAR